MSTKQNIAIKLTTDISFVATSNPKHTIESIRQAMASIVTTAVEKDSVLRMLCIAGNDEYLLTSWRIDNGVEYDESYTYIISDLLDEICKLVLTIGKYTYPVTLGSNKSVDDVLDKVTGILIANDVIDSNIHKEMIKELEQIALKLLNMIDYTYSRYREAIEVCWKGADGNPVTECIITPVEEGDVKRAIENLKKANAVIEYLDNIKQLATDKDTSVIEMITNADDATSSKNKSVVNRGLVRIIGNTANDMLSKQLRGLHNLAKTVDWLILYPNSRLNYKKYIKLLVKHKDTNEASRKVYDQVANELMEYISLLTYNICYHIDGIRLVVYIDSRWCYTTDIDYKDMK